MWTEVWVMMTMATMKRSDHIMSIHDIKLYSVNTVLHFSYERFEGISSLGWMRVIADLISCSNEF